MSEEFNPPPNPALDKNGNIVVKSEGRQYFLKPGRAEYLIQSMESFVFGRDNDDTNDEAFKIFMTGLDLGPKKVGEAEYLRQEFKRINQDRNIKNGK